MFSGAPRSHFGGLARSWTAAIFGFCCRREPIFGSSEPSWRYTSGFAGRVLLSKPSRDVSRDVFLCRLEAVVETRATRLFVHARGGELAVCSVTITRVCLHGMRFGGELCNMGPRVGDVARNLGAAFRDAYWCLGLPCTAPNVSERYANLGRPAD